jgi:2-polyprenyl-6-hydroxyphenyl methylase/3-demethylubiquinone-9 3-methyltransferase
VATIRAVLERFTPGVDWTVEKADPLDPATLPKEKVDTVYSCGVLHHTGDMWPGIRNAARYGGPER